MSGFLRKLKNKNGLEATAKRRHKRSSRTSAAEHHNLCSTLHPPHFRDRAHRLPRVHRVLLRRGSAQDRNTVLTPRRTPQRRSPSPSSISDVSSRCRTAHFSGVITDDIYNRFGSMAGRSQWGAILCEAGSLLLWAGLSHSFLLFFRAIGLRSILVLFRPHETDQTCNTHTHVKQFIQA